MHWARLSNGGFLGTFQRIPQEEPARWLENANSHRLTFFIPVVAARSCRSKANSTSLFNQALGIPPVAKKSGLPYFPKVTIASQIECSISCRGRAENDLFEWAAFEKHGIIFAGPHDVNDAVLVDAEEKAACDH